MNEEYGFYFEKCGLSGRQGATNAGEEIFRPNMAQAVARELIQNSIDARNVNDQPVLVQFELREMSTRSIPDYENLSLHIKAASEYANADRKNVRLHDAANDILKASIPVLRVGDYNTTGLQGSESLRDTDSPLGALTHDSGVSAGKNDSGGSFGVGKTVGTAASSIRTELWTTRRQGEGTTIFAGLSQLSTHIDPTRRTDSSDEENLLSSNGHYTLKSDHSDFHFLHGSIQVGPFPERTELGTDTYILGYADAADVQLTEIKRAVVDNFMAAIMRGTLIVEGITELGTWRLDQETIAESCRDEGPEVFAFYRALCEQPIIGNLPRLGTVKLYVNVDNGLEKKLDTVCMRKPLMKVKVMKQARIRAKYAAVFECSSPEGNELLRQMEPVSHDDWHKTTKNGENVSSVISNIQSFIRTTLRDQIRNEVGDEMELKIDSLNALLPAEFQADPMAVKQGTSAPGTGSGTEKETSSIQGKPSDALSVTNKEGKSIPVNMSMPAIADDGAKDVKTGMKRGGSHVRGQHTTGVDTSGDRGEGNSEIKSSDISMRSWLDTSKDSYTLILRTRDGNSATGSIHLIALLDGSDEDSVPIVSISQETEHGLIPLEFEGGVIKKVSIPEQSCARLHVKVSGNKRLELAVK